MLVLQIALPAQGQTVAVEVGSFPQDVAVHREMAQPPETDIQDIVSTAAGMMVQSDQAWYVLDNQAWRISESPKVASAGLADSYAVRQIAIRKDGRRAAATDRGVFEQLPGTAWVKLTIADDLGRTWATSDVRGVTYDSHGDLWIASLAGVIRREEKGWTFYTGSEGLPYNDFTCCMAAGNGDVWFGTTKGAIRYRRGVWAYRQGQRWLPDDQVRAIAVDSQNQAWFATGNGVGCIEQQTMTLQAKATFYEDEIDRLIKRTPYGYTSEVSLPEPGQKQNVIHHDSDNDGLWTAMYGASQCYAYAVTKSEIAKQRAKQAFEALRFLQTVTQGGQHSPPRGYVARTILPASGPDPNEGRMEHDRLTRANGDRLWKVYEPRWPLSADGQWYWKSDTSSDELDGHYYFYPLYYDLVADDESEKAAVRQVVADLTDHLIMHDYVLMEHDGTPTRWAVFRPHSLNHSEEWTVERGLNSLSMLSYLAVAKHVTGQQKYDIAAEKLMREYSFDTNAMVPKMQRGPGSGNQSDDEMAFMSFYNLLKYSHHTEHKKKWLAAFYAYWMMEQPERNPFFNFAYAAHGQNQTYQDAFANRSLSPWGGWLDDSLQTLISFPLDRINWAQNNSHRLDLVRLPKQQGPGMLGLNDGDRGYRVDGKVLPVDERFFNHWNTDPWQLDYGGNGQTLASGAVYLLPYYMGRYHGFINEAK
ncbi:MAG: hypothetical protein R3C28_05330 [Pirellulaceae bacterium]